MVVKPSHHHMTGEDGRLANLKKRTRGAINALRNHPDVLYADGHWRGTEVWAGLYPESDGSTTLENIAWAAGLELKNASIKSTGEYGQVLDLEYKLIDDYDIPVDGEDIEEVLRIP